MDVTQTSSAVNSANTSNSTNGNSGGALSSDFETFLNLLTAQIKNQDPTEPIDSTAWVAQLATFSSVEQQVLTNDLLAGMQAQLSLGNLTDVAAWVGKEARVAAPAYYDGNPITIAPNPPIIADRVELVATNELGTEVYRAEIPVTADAMEWNGLNEGGIPFASGQYAFTIESFVGDQQIATGVVDIYSEVTEVRSVGGITMMVLEGGVLVAASTATALRTPNS